MNFTEQTAIRQGAMLYEEIGDSLDARTLEILDQRRRTAVVRRRGWLIRRALLLADIVGLGAAFLLAQLLFGMDFERGDRIDPALEYAIFIATLPFWVVVAKIYGLYDRDEERTDHSTADDVVTVFHVVTVGAWLYFVTAWMTQLVGVDIPKLLSFWAFAILFVAIGRGAARAFCRRRLTYLQNAVIVGAGDVGQLVAQKLLQHPEYGINLVGFVDSQPRERRADLEHLTLIGGVEELPRLIRLLDVERVVIAFSNESHDDTLALVRSLKTSDVQIDIVPRLFEVFDRNIGIHSVEGLPLIGLARARLSARARIGKRLMDVSLSCVALALLAPAFLAIALAIKLDSPGPVFFRQLRMGTGNRTFRIFKFRTMAVDADERKREIAHLNVHAQDGGDPRMFKVPDDPRITRVGRFLRRFSLDELPQFLNVVTGEMSLVGPRPLILDEDQYVVDWARERLAVRPGITGAWQVLGRSNIPFEEMTKLDYLYVTNWSLRADLRLMLQTIPVLIRASRAY